jgi:hypothetical protein
VSKPPALGLLTETGSAGLAIAGIEAIEIVENAKANVRLNATDLSVFNIFLPPPDESFF